MKLIYITSNFTLKNFLADILERANFKFWMAAEMRDIKIETGIIMTECNIS